MSKAPDLLLSDVKTLYDYKKRLVHFRYSALALIISKIKVGPSPTGKNVVSYPVLLHARELHDFFFKLRFLIDSRRIGKSPNDCRIL